MTTPVLSHGFSALEAASLVAAGLPVRQLPDVLATYSDLDAYLASPGARTPSEPQLADDMWVLVLGGAGYPAQLAAMPTPPVLVYGRGDPAALRTGVAVVGTRAMSDYGRIVAETAAQAAVDIGAPVHSGLALGVDGASHRAALAAGGVTVAVLGCGIDAPTPGEHVALAEEILEQGGAVIAEVPPRTARSGQHLVARNRIIVGLSSLTVVAEGGLRSGTAHSVLAAVDAGRMLVVARPKAHARSIPGAELPLALADPAGIKAAALRATGRVAEKLAQLGPVANAVAEDREALRELIELGHRFYVAPARSSAETAPEEVAA